MKQTDQIEIEIRQTSVAAAPQADGARQKADLFISSLSQYCLLWQAEGAWWRGGRRGDARLHKEIPPTGVCVCVHALRDGSFHWIRNIPCVSHSRVIRELNVQFFLCLNASLVTAMTGAGMFLLYLCIHPCSCRAISQEHLQIWAKPSLGLEGRLILDFGGQRLKVTRTNWKKSYELIYWLWHNGTILWTCVTQNNLKNIPVKIYSLKYNICYGIAYMRWDI